MGNRTVHHLGLGPNVLRVTVERFAIRNGDESLTNHVTISIDDSEEVRVSYADINHIRDVLATTMERF